MNRASLKYLFLIMIILSTCSGCKQDYNIIGDSFSIEPDRPHAVKYKNGAILVKEDNQYNVTNQKNSVDFNISIKEIKFGPKDVNFANKNG